MEALPPLPSAPPMSTAASEMGPPRKKPRLSPEAHGTISERTMDDLETALEVDHMILDYLLHQAIRTCFSNSKSPQGPDDAAAVEKAVSQVDEFLALFKYRYARYRFDAQMRFRQTLLQLVTLFTQRLSRNLTTPPRASLQTLRQNNQARARRWIGSADRLPTCVYGDEHKEAFDKDLPVSANQLDENRAYALVSLDRPTEDDAYEDEFYGTNACVSLLDLLPLFIKVSATCSEGLGINVGSKWMKLAGEWMLEACLEQYLVFGASGTDAMDEAFAWGYKEGGSNDGDGQSDDETNNMFCDGNSGTEATKWQSIKTQMLDELFSTAKSKDLVTGLLELRTVYTQQRIEQDILGFLEALAQVIPKPIITKLQEEGQLEGFTKNQTKAMLKDWGVDMVALLGAN